jgi:hypothetical protein
MSDVSVVRREDKHECGERREQGRALERLLACWARSLRLSERTWIRILAATRLSVNVLYSSLYTSCQKEIQKSTDAADADRIWRRLVT